MSPQEFPKRAPDGRPMRRPLSIDGFSPAVARRPPPIRSFQRPVMSRDSSVAPLAPPNPISSTQSVLQPRPVLSASQPSQNTASQAAPLEFRLPLVKRSRKQRILRFGLLCLVALVIIGGAVAFFAWQARQHDPARAFDAALTASLSTRKLRADVTTPDGSSQLRYDFSNLTNPTVSNQATIKLAGATFGVEAYGTAQNTYLSYHTLPDVINRPMALAVQDAWVQLRTKGIQAAGVSKQLANLTDPRYQNFGPVIIGNFSPQTRVQLLRFIRDHKVYQYDAKKVTTKTLDSHRVFVYPVKLDIDYLKIANQSAAISYKFTPADLQAATSALEGLRETGVTFYVDVKTHHLQQIDLTKGDQRTTIAYSQYDSASLPAEPQTKLTWGDFARLQWQMEAQAATHQPAASRDATRKADAEALHTALAAYFVQNNRYPTMNNLNDQAWVAANLPGLDPTVFRDPDAANLQLADKPKAGTYAYQPVSATGKTGCHNSVANACAHYKLIATLSTGTALVKQDP